MTLWRNLVVALVAAFALAACSSSGDNGDTSMPMPTDPGPSAYEAALEAIAGAETAEAAQKVVDDLDADAVTGAQLQSLNMAVAQKTMELADAAAAAERQALVTAAMCTAGTAECVAAHQALVDALEADDTTTVTDLAAARTALATVQTAKDEADAAAQAAATRQGLVDAAACMAATAECVAAHQALVDALEADDTTSEEDLAAARTALSTVQTAKNVADAAAQAAATRQGLVDAAACTAGTAECVAAHEALVAALMADDTTLASDLAAAQANLAAAQMAKRVQDAADARQMLVTAAMCEDATPECVAHHDALITALEKDLADLQASDDATNAEEAAAMKAVADAKATRDAVEMQRAEIDRSTDTGAAVGNAVDAANGLADMRSAEDIMAAEDLLETAKGMLTDADDYAEQIEMVEMAIARAKARNAVDAAVMAAETASDALDDDQSKATVEAARAAVDAAKKALADNADALLDADEAGYNRQIELAEAPVGPLERQIAAMEDEEQRKADADMMATAMKLYDGLEHGLGDTNNVRTGASDTAGVISVTIGTDAAVPLAEDKKTTVADLLGWDGMRHTAEPTGDVGTYEAMVYSNVGDPTEGEKFSAAYPSTEAFVSETGVVTIDTSGTDTPASQVDSPRFDQSAGTKTFKLPAPNPSGVTRITIPGSFHGVAGTYTCTPSGGHCAATIAEEGFTLGFVDEGTTTGAGTWTFTPTNADARVMSVADAIYASYGWWLHKSEDGKTYTASAFATSRGTVPAAAGITALRGTATYMGGAAGKYALYSSTGGTNDAGHFTAKATLEANFNNDTITGTIDSFMGSDGESKDWEVELKASVIGDTGEISGSAAQRTATDTLTNQQTVWTIGEDPAAAAGQWSGTLYDNGDDGVPTVGTGTFHSTYSTSGRMVGAFGVDVQ